MTASDETQSTLSITKGQRLERIRRVKRMREAGISRAVICRKMGLARATLKGYIDDFYLLDDAPGPKKEAPPKVRKCLHCGFDFSPDSRFRFMCNSCNNFARGAMV